jgi:hypothetical protein
LLDLGGVDHRFGTDHAGVRRGQMQAQREQTENDQVTDGFGETTK